MSECPFRCPYCGSNDVVYEHSFYFVLHTDRVYKCKKCGKTFIVCFPRYRGKPEIIYPKGGDLNG